MPPKHQPVLTVEELEAMLAVTKIEKAPMRMALIEHLVNGKGPLEAAELHQVSRQQLSGHVKNLMTKIRPAFERYAELQKHRR